MVKIINIDTKTRTIRVENADSDIKTWRTTESGTHFPIKKGESTKEALDKFVEKKRPEAKKESGLLGDIPTPDEQLKTPKAREVYDRLTRYASEHNKDLQEDDMKHLRSLRDILLDDNNAAEHVEKNFQKWFGSSKQQQKPSKKESGWPESPKFEKLTEQYMPKQGEADNELGEVLRSINQVVYRYYNDGDMWNKGYGKETVNGAIKHLTELSKNKETPRHIARGLDNALFELKKYGVKDKDRYETALKIMMQTMEWADEKDIESLSKMKRNTEKQQPAKPSKSADVSDIVKNYKKQMEAAGPRASLKKTDRIQADAIKEFMTRKLGANRPYEDYYEYWLNGMDKKTSDQFTEIYTETEAREMAFSELASDVDHSGLARGEPTYDELMKWAEEQKAKKQTSQKETKSSKFDSRTLDRKLVRGGLSDSEIDDLAKMQDYYDISDETINAAIDAGEYSVKEIFKRLRNYDDDFATHLSDFREDYQKSTKQPKQSSQPTSYDLDDAFDEADLGSEWGRAKHRMDFHGVSQYTIKDIIDSGKYEAGDIIEALESNSHDKIDEMRKSLKDK